MSVKQPPNASEAEQNVLGCLLVDNGKFAELADLRAEDFYTASHQVLFTAIGNMIRAKQPCDFLTIVERLRDDALLEECGGASYVRTLAYDAYSTSGLRAYADIVRERADRRAVIAACSDAAQESYQGDDAHAVVAKLQASLALIGARKVTGAVPFSDAVISAVAQFEAVQELRKRGGSAGVPWGIPELDRSTGGGRPGELIGIAARTSVGKTAMALQFAVHAATHGHAGLFITLEENPASLALRAISNRGSLNLSRLRNGDDTMKAVLAHVVSSHNLAQLPLWIESRTFDLQSILARIARHQRRDGIKFAVVDHIGLVGVAGRHGAKRYELVGEITRSLKRLSEEIQIPIYPLIQIGRDSDKEQRRPRLTDLRESGDIEQDLNICLAAHPLPVADPDAKPDAIRMELGFLKSRFGPRGWLPQTYVFRGAYQRIEEQDHYEAAA